MSLIRILNQISRVFDNFLSYSYEGLLFQLGDPLDFYFLVILSFIVFSVWIMFQEKKSSKDCEYQNSKLAATNKLSVKILRDGTDKWFKNLDSSTYYISKIILILPLAQKISYHVDINDQYYQSQGLRLQTIWWLQGHLSCLSWQKKSRDCKELIWWLRVNCLGKWLRYSDESVCS